MKRIILLSILLCIGLTEAHSQTVYFGYDAAGNRNIRTIDIEEIGEAPPEDDDESIVEKSVDKGPSGVSVYPNPTAQTIYVKLDEMFDEKALLILLDPDGRVLVQRRIDGVLSEIDIQHNSQGIYILRLMVGKEERRAWRIIKN